MAKFIGTGGAKGPNQEHNVIQAKDKHVKAMKGLNKSSRTKLTKTVPRRRPRNQMDPIEVKRRKNLNKVGRVITD